MMIDMFLDLGDVAGALVGASAVGWGCLARRRRAEVADGPDWSDVEDRSDHTGNAPTGRTIAGSALTWVYEVDPAKMPPGDLNYPASFFFPGDFSPTRPPVSLVDWWAWAHGVGGSDVRTTKVVITLQALEEVSITVGSPILDHAVREAPHGVLCCPEGVGGGGVPPRTYEVNLSAPGGPTARYADRKRRPPEFVLAAGRTEQIEVIAYADSGWHEWTMRLPVTVDGQLRELDLSLYGDPFVTVGGSVGCHQLMWSGGRWS